MKKILSFIFILLCISHNVLAYNFEIKPYIGSDIKFPTKMDANAMSVAYIGGLSLINNKYIIYSDLGVTLTEIKGPVFTIGLGYKINKKFALKSFIKRSKNTKMKTVMEGYEERPEKVKNYLIDYGASLSFGGIDEYGGASEVTWSISRTKILQSKIPTGWSYSIGMNLYFM